MMKRRSSGDVLIADLWVVVLVAVLQRRATEALGHHTSFTALDSDHARRRHAPRPKPCPVAGYATTPEALMRELLDHRKPEGCRQWGAGLRASRSVSGQARSLLASSRRPHRRVRPTWAVPYRH
jgi:hypothetical protein